MLCHKSSKRHEPYAISAWNVGRLPRPSKCTSSEESLEATFRVIPDTTARTWSIPYNVSGTFTKRVVWRLIYWICPLPGRNRRRACPITHSWWFCMGIQIPQVMWTIVIQFIVVSNQVIQDWLCWWHQPWNHVRHTRNGLRGKSRFVIVMSSRADTVMHLDSFNCSICARIPIQRCCLTWMLFGPNAPCRHGCAGQNAVHKFLA